MYARRSGELVGAVMYPRVALREGDAARAVGLAPADEWATVDVLAPPLRRDGAAHLHERDPPDHPLTPADAQRVLAEQTAET